MNRPRSELSPKSSLLVFGCGVSRRLANLLSFDRRDSATPDSKRRLPGTRLLAATGRLSAGLVLLASSVSADTIVLSNGQRLVGRATEVGDQVQIELASGSKMTISKSRIARIIAAPLPQEELVLKEKALTNGDAEAVFALALWCDQQGLRDDVERLEWRTLEIDPDHAAAREALGFQKLGAIWLTEADYQRAHGKLFFDGQWLEPSAHERAVRKAKSSAQLAEAKKLFRTASGRDPEEKRHAALQKFRSMPTSVRNWTLLKATDSLRTRERQFAVREMGASKVRKYHNRLTHLAVTDSKRSIRDEALLALQSWEDRDTVLTFIPYLSSGNERMRINATRALNVFPDRRAVGPLIRTAHYIWAGFGRAHISVITQHAYVSDYELVSGGTGLVVQEVADPVVDTFQEGVVLDISIRKAEAFARAATLQAITGQKFGTDFGHWASWWKDETGREVKSIPTAVSFKDSKSNGDEQNTEKAGRAIADPKEKQ